MKKDLCLILLLLLLLTFIIIPGCGGESNITPSSLGINPTPVNSESAYGYLKITIVWPQSGKEGKCIISSEDGQHNLTTSMTEDTDYITIKVRDKYYKTDPEAYFPTGGYYIFAREPGEKSITKILGPIPATDVIVRAVSEAHSSITGTSSLISITEQEFQIKPGTEGNAISLNLGDYKLKVEPEKKTIVIGETIKITATLTIEDSTGHSVAAEGALKEKDIEFTISGKKIIVKTDKDGKAITNVPGETVGPMPIVAEFKPIPSDPNTFKVAETSVDISGSGRYVLTVTSSNSQVILSSKPADSKTSSIQANAAPVPSPEEVEISVNLMYIGPSQPGGSTPVPVAVEAKEIEFTATNSNNSSAGEFEPTSIITNGDGNGTSKLLFNNPGTITIKGSLKEDPTVYDECIITVNRDYYLQFAAGDVQIIPDFKTTNTDNIQQSKKTFISVELRKPDANDPLQSLIPAAEETITLTKEEGPGVIPASVVTDQDGHAYAEIDYSGYNGGSTQTIIKASFNNPINSNYTSEISTSFYFTVPIYVDTFEKYSYYTYVYDLYQWTAGYPYYASWIAGGEAKDVESFIDNIGANNTNQSIKLNSNDSPAWVTSKIGYWKTKVGPYYHITKELRFYICPEHDAKAVVTIGGMLGLSDIITFKDNKIYDAKGEEIENISYPANWYPVRVQILGSQSNPLEKIKLNYFMEGEFKKSIILPNLYISSDGICSLTLKSNSGNVWFDQIELYNDFYELN